MFLISIVVPIYNTAQYLGECIESISSQSYKNIEIILVDDGSTDNSLEVSEKYAEKDSRIQVVHKENGGLSDARNVGIKHSTGDYILFIDSDDFISKGSLKCIVNTIEEMVNTDVIFLEAMKYYEEDARAITLGDGYKKECIMNQSKEEVFKHLAKLPKYPGSACTKLVRRALILENNLFFVKGITNEDLEWTIRLLMAGNRFNYCDTPYYFYRQNRKGSITNIFSEKKFVCLLEFIIEYSTIDKNSELWRFKNEIYSFIAYEYFILLANYAKLEKTTRKKYIKYLKEYKWLINYRKDKKCKIIKIVLKIVGIEITAKLLKNFLRIRG